MDGSRFDALTRRHVGLAVGGAAALAGLAGMPSADAGKNARRKRKKKRCKKLGDTCVQGGKRKCCGELRCDVHSGNSLPQPICCKTAGKSCVELFDCCFPAQCEDNVCVLND
jgi:hypothetical protein